MVQDMVNYHRVNGPSGSKSAPVTGQVPQAPQARQAPQAPPASHNCHGYNNGPAGAAPFEASRYSTSNSNSAVVEQSGNTNASSSSMVRPAGPYSAAVSSPAKGKMGQGNVSVYQSPTLPKTTSAQMTTPPLHGGHAGYENREDAQHWGPGSAVAIDSSTTGRPQNVTATTNASNNASSVYSTVYQPRHGDDRAGAAHRAAAANAPVPWGKSGSVPHRTEGPPPPPRYGGHGPYETSFQALGGGGPPPTQSYPPPVGVPSSHGHHLHHRHHPVPPFRYPYTNRVEDQSSASQTQLQQQQQQHVRKEAFNDVDGREGATSPSQIESTHRDEVTNMGCTCKKTKCLKLYCQCFAVKIYCGSNCRCLVCFNIAKHEKQRKEAMRNILTRNASAFDTKFLKTKEKVTAEPALVLAHKRGCKCRKSACMKKYCECYAGNVKCSATCGCVGCKNIPTGGFGGSSSSEGALPGIPTPVESGSAEYDIMSKASGVAGFARSREPWMMNAAQNLTFLKHGSPSYETRASANEVHSEVTSMPSLAASSSDTSPDDHADDSVSMKPFLSPRPGGREQGGGAVNTLLLAAYAMTELPSRNPSDTRSFDSPKQLKSLSPETSTPGASQTLQTRKELFRPSPKRKSSDIPASSETTRDHTYHNAVVGVEESRHQQLYHTEHDNIATSTEIISEDRSHANTVTVATPLMDQRKIKRTRLGSVCKKMSWESTDSQPLQTSAAIVEETPTGKQGGPTETLTPVSARCIDFRRMNVNENASEVKPS